MFAGSDTYFLINLDGINNMRSHTHSLHILSEIPNLLQIAEVVNSMKDLIDSCRDNKVGPIGNFLKVVLPFKHFFQTMNS